MKLQKQRLILEHADRKLQPFARLVNTPLPTEGWINTIREALNMSLRQLGNKLNISPQGVKKLEQNEKNGTVTIQSLHELAKALDMKLVYGFVPLKGSLDALITAKAKQVAEKIVGRSANTMKLEDQETSNERSQAAIIEKTNELKNEMPKFLWE